ncbi:hypothetical protein PPERSA_04712 [Pseudocohnilembus persalinus]|uniref:SGNH hydrolase-type esterase domain-containing protein n=1 Tax=Pseudocohnilembus persalinus TaxID=266149 RepID=A0A0V0R4K9_PSEPJ|nr:hypothetical protein PPERSA_04712 [Pseudocohnilembus persalinus]|eukprot:KRX09406.1 hypothetical protein PPERSA_04712 [Pseudocohnilembus persalinus]
MGDSLTEGLYDSWSYEFSPYTLILGDRLRNKYKDIDIQIFNEGVSGEKVQNMPERLQKILSEQNFDFMILLGGTNDLGYGIPPKDIAKNLLDLLQQAWKQNMVTLQLTVPQCKGAIQNKQRDQLNDQIRKELVKQNSKAFLLDFHEKFDLNNMTENDKVDLWARDGLHFSQKGYEKMGEYIFDAIEKNEIIQKIIDNRKN